MKKFGMHPLFFLLGIMLIIWGYSKIFFVYILVVIFHEFAHSFTAKRLGYKIDKIFLLPFGASLNLQQNFEDENDEILIALAGPLTNFFLAFLFIALWWIFPNLYNFTSVFVYANMINGLINLLPCFPLDGGRIFVAYMSKKIKRKKAINICLVFNYIITFLLLIIFIINIKNNINITYLIMAIFIFLGTFENKFSGNYSLLNIPFKSQFNAVKPFFDTNIIAVNSNIYLYKMASKIKKNKFNIFYVIFPNKKIKILTEFNLENLLLKYPPDIIFDNILDFNP